MKTIKPILITATFILFARLSYGQAPESVAPQMKQAAAAEAAQNKTLTTLDLLSNLYQISANDLTADSKSVKFKSTIFGLEKVFNPNVNDSRTYEQKWLERYLEPYLNFNYKNKFDPSDLSLGVNFSFINANDKTSSKDLSRPNAKLKARIAAVDVKIDAYIKKINTRFQPKDLNDDAEKKMMSDASDNATAALTSFVRSADETALTPEMKKELEDAGIVDDVKTLKISIDSLALRIANRWNVTFSPEATYAFNRSAIQGVSLLLNAIKGAKILSKRSTQFTLKAGYVFGDDTVIKVNRIGRNQIQSWFGFNQVIFTKSLTANDGTKSDVPCTELAVNYGLNYITRGYMTDEKRRQPSLNAKLGFLIGKDSWLVIPFTYNYATKTTYASLSVKVNLGDAPFKATK